MASTSSPPAISVQVRRSFRDQINRILTRRGQQMKGLITATLETFAADPEPTIAHLAPVWPEPKRRGRPSAAAKSADSDKDPLVNVTARISQDLHDRVQPELEQRGLFLNALVMAALIAYAKAPARTTDFFSESWPAPGQPGRKPRPETDAARKPAELRAAAAEALERRGLQLRDFHRATYAAVADKPDQVLQSLAPYLPASGSPPKR